MAEARGEAVTRRPLRLRVETTAAPEPHLLRAAIAARLDGHAFPSLPEDEIAARVAAAVRAQLEETRPGWR
jgi:hypothetical protein